ncbi:MAG: S9 family peptidase [Planctomycetes bacterium]|nr:S9 family peptidase [Planctomycetota bacterium]
MPVVAFVLIALLSVAQSPPPSLPSLPPPASEATSAPGVAEVHPTVAEIFKPPRLLGVRPRGLAVSATGRFVLWRHAQDDAEEQKLGWWLAPTDGSAEPNSLFSADAGVEADWAPSGDVLLVFRSGWIERLDIATGAPSEPLFQCGPRRARLTFTEDGRFALFTAGADHELWVLELATGARWSPARQLADRTPWFEWIEATREIALFAAPPRAGTSAEGGGAAADAKPPRSGRAAFEEDVNAAVKAVAAEDSKDSKKPTADGVKRVLWRVPFPVAGEAREPVPTALEESGRVDLSADGRFALIAQLEAEDRRQLIVADFLAEQVRTVPVRGDLAGDPPPKVNYSIVEVATAATITLPLDEGERYYQSEARWSPQGARLLLQRVSEDFKVRQLLVAEPAERRAWPLFVERDDAWIGGPIQFAEWRGDGEAIVFASEKHGHAQLFLAPAVGGGARELTARDSEVQEAVLLHDRQHIVAITNQRDPAERSLTWIDLADGAARELETPRSGCVGDFVVARDGSAAAFLFESLGVPAEVWSIATLEGARSTQLSETMPDALRDLGLPPPDVVAFKSGDGTALRALYYPPQPPPRAGAKAPAVLFVHGAGYLQNVTRSMTEYPQNYLFHQRLARQGFAVLDVDYRHSAGYGRDFRTGIHGFMGGKDLDDLLAGVEWLRARGDVDGTRVGLYGGSYGGFLTLMALFTKPEVFACGAALRSVTDWRTYNSWYTTPRLGDPKADAENYRKSSPIDHADGLKKPLLILHGLKDSNVFAQDSIRLIEKLIQLGKEFDAMLYPSQDHGFTDPESWIDEYRRIERLFVRELRPAVTSG